MKRGQVDTLPGDALLCVWGAAVVTVLRMVQNGEPTDEIERSARHALELATRPHR